MSEQIQLTPCARCGEDAIMVELDGKYFVRVRRFSKCKNYKRGLRACQTEWCDTPEEAATEWKMCKANPFISMRKFPVES